MKFLGHDWRPGSVIYCGAGRTRACSSGSRIPDAEDNPELFAILLGDAV
jgi:hypothetical protein